ncbi:MAG: DUF6265 family protein [Gemmatimonadota bacterium]|nr:DUF6265 family protein [Gemmatimonadota bacterium]
MTQRTLAASATALCLLLLPTLASAQSLQTPNTLALEASAPRPKATLADLKLLVGHWRGGFLGSTAEEVWLPAAGGTMLGVARIYKEDAVVFYETMIAVEEEGSVSLKLKHFHPNLKGWEEKDDVVTFRLVKASGNTLWFEGLTFRKREDGSLQGFVAISYKDGTVKEESFVYQPVAGR